MRLVAAVLGCCAVLAQSSVWAQAPADPVGWLGRIASASQRLNYVGSFVYQSRGQVEISRIVHRVDAQGEHERVEVLDGSPREIVRHGAEVHLVLPDHKMVVIDQASRQLSFPARLPDAYAKLADNYRVSKGEVGRVVGRDAQMLVLAPRDDLRYGHTLWADVQTGLLLKSRLVDEQGAVIEQFSFSDLRIGGEIERELLQPRYVPGDGWRVVNARASELAPHEAGWALAEPVPGYALQTVMRRPLRKGRGEAIHLVFSDGLASVSVFIEPAGQAAERRPVPHSNGAINIYHRTVEGHQLTVLGEVPERALQRIGNQLQPVRP